MTRLVIILIVSGIVAAAIAAVAAVPGEFLLTIGSYQIHTGAGLGLALLLAFIVLLILVLQFLAFVWRSPRMFGRWHSARRAREGQEVLSQGLVAAAAEDASEARRCARRAESLLGSQPLVLLLKAQSAALDEDTEREHEIYRAMLDRPDTELLGLHGLYALAVQGGDEISARGYAERARSLRPQASWLPPALPAAPEPEAPAARAADITTPEILPQN